VRYNAMMASHLHNKERKVIGHHRNGAYCVAKGKTPEQRCINFFKQLARYKDPVIISGDHSRFDAHVNKQLKLLLDKSHLRARGYHPELRRALKFRRKVKGQTKGGIVYVIEGKVESGDIDTGMGNTEINEWLIIGFCEFEVDLDPEQYDYCCDGDDFYIIVERANLGLLDKLPQYMLDCGMVTEIEVNDDPFKVEFCQSRPCILPGGPTFVRNPMKVLATLGQSPEIRTRSQMQQSVRATCLCEMAMAPGSPINSVVARRIYNILGEGKAAFNPAQAWKYEQYGMTEFRFNDVEPDWLARYTFWRAWGIDDGEQFAYEHMQYVTAAKCHERTKPMKTNLLQMEVENMGVVDASCECGDCPTYDVALADLERWL